MLSSLEKSRKNTFVIWLTRKKKFVQHSESLPQRLSKKFIGDNLSITDIALRNWDLAIIDIAQSIFEVIDYCYDVIALVQKGLSCPSLGISYHN